MPESVIELQQEVSRLQAQVEELTAELVESNQGVLALYAELDDNAARLWQILRNFISNAAPEHLPALFQDFVQVDAPIQKRLRGTGLGLSLSRKLALLLGGDVAVESTLGEGSTFSVILPLELAVDG